VVWRDFMATVRLLGSRKRSFDRDPTLLLGDFPRLSLDYGDGPCPTSRRALDLRWKAAHGKAGRGQGFEVVQLLDVTIADVTTRLVALPDDGGVVGRGVALGCMNEWRVPAPAVGARYAHSLLEQVERCLGPHAAARGDIVRLAVFHPGAGVDDHDLEWLQRMADAAELRFDIGGRGDIAVSEMAKVELDPGLETPVERNFVDRPGALALVHRWMIVPGRVEMRAVVG
jgi:hypothetical protein